MFDNINKTTDIAAQKVAGDTIVKSKGGRPPRPNMRSYTFRMDKNLHDKLNDFARKNGTHKSAVINSAIRAYLAHHEQETSGEIYRLVKTSFL